MNTKELLEKYYAGQTSLNEEKLLQTILNSEGNDNEIIEKLIFNTFSEEKNETAPPTIKIFSPPTKKRKISKKWLLYITSGIAACLLFVSVSGIFINNRNKHEDTAYLYVDGVRIDNQDLAIRHIKNIDKKINIVTKKLETLNKIIEIETELKLITNKINSYEENNFYN